MTPERWGEVEDLYHKALQVRKEERASFLESHCLNNESLRQEVESLLSRYEGAGSFLDEPAAKAGAALRTEPVLSLHVGSRLGLYEITGLLGKGGFGEVYRARDIQLKRDVAIKILPDEFSREPDRVARFQREAQLLASLNHPNIAAIHSLGEAEGTRFLVLELVEGETLQRHLQRGPIPLDQALPIAKQIAEALEAAHEKGITHRDLKPANVKLTPEARVKVLDFGLAKARVTSSPSANLPDSPILMSGSMQGAIIGTAAYMSPEQAKGKEVDRTADVWAFGCVLYEMLTGRHAFEGEDVTEILGRVVAAEPDFTRLPTRTPPSIRRLLRRAMKKDPRQRLADMRDARIEIEEASAAPDVAVPPAFDAAAMGRRQRFWPIVAGVSLIVIAALAIPTARHLREAPSPNDSEMRLDMITPATTDPFSFAISPDGRKVVFVASGDGTSRLWLRPLDVSAAQPLLGTEGATRPFWSPDSRSVGFFSAGKLMRADIGGGLPQTLVSAINPAGLGGSWSPGGLILFASSSTNRILRVPASGGEAVTVTNADWRRAGVYTYPQFLPGGRRFLFTAWGGGAVSAVYLGSLDSPEIKRVTAADSAGLYAPPGWLLFVRQGQLVARRFDLSRGELAGDPITLADQVSVDSFVPVPPFSVSASGSVAYRRGGPVRTQLAWFDRTGKMLGTVGEADENNLGYPELSPDERRVAVDRTVQGNQDIWLIDLLRGGTARFTFDSANDRRPLWSPDGLQIVFAANRKQTFELYTEPSTGAGAEQLIMESPYSKVPDGLSPDGHFVLYNENRDILAVPLQGDRKPIPVANSPFTKQDGQFSPDGRWVAYHSDESGRFEIYVVPFPPAAGKWQVSADGGVSPRWRHDGKELFFISPDEKMMAATVSSSGASFQADPPVPLFQTRIVGGFNAGKQQYAVSAEGHFLINVPAADSASVPITLILNWHPPAK